MAERISIPFIVGALRHQTQTPGGAGVASAAGPFAVARLVSFKSGASMRNTFVKRGGCAASSKHCWMRLFRVFGPSETARGAGPVGDCGIGSRGRMPWLVMRRLPHMKRRKIRIRWRAMLIPSPSRSFGACQRLFPGPDVERDESGINRSERSHYPLWGALERYSLVILDKVLHCYFSYKTHSYLQLFL